jgi:type IV pilus assembly protein PilV
MPVVNAMRQHQRGFTLLEVLITIVILAFGLLGLVNLQAKLHMTEMEAYQRAQAVVLLQDFANRVQAGGATAYVTDADGDGVDAGDWLGTGATFVCSPAPTAGTIAAEKCDWSDQLLGAAETAPDGPDADSLPDQVGGMIGGRGCVEQLQTQDLPTCRPSIYRVTVAWQGLYETVAPDLTCASGQYGTDALRRVISTTVTIGLPECLPPL